MALSPLGPAWTELIDESFAALGIEALPSETRALLCALLDETVIWGKKVDLTAARSARELVDLTLADACVIARETRAAGAEARGRWVDVGSGAGAPGLPLALLLPELEIELVEPRVKRVAFLRTVAGKLALLRVQVRRELSFALEPASYQVAVSRATLPPAEWLAEGARLASSAVWVLLANAEPPVLDGWQPLHDIRYEWPLTASPRRALCYTKHPRPESSR